MISRSFCLVHSLTGFGGRFLQVWLFERVSVTVKLFFATLVLHSFLRARIGEAPCEIPSTKTSWVCLVAVQLESISEADCSDCSGFGRELISSLDFFLGQLWWRHSQKWDGSHCHHQLISMSCKKSKEPTTSLQRLAHICVSQGKKTSTFLQIIDALPAVLKGWGPKMPASFFLESVWLDLCWGCVPRWIFLIEEYHQTTSYCKHRPLPCCISFATWTLWPTIPSWQGTNQKIELTTT